MARYQNIMIQILSDSNLNSKEDLIQLFKDTTATTPLGGIFFVTLVTTCFDYIFSYLLVVKLINYFFIVKHFTFNINTINMFCCFHILLLNFSKN